MSERGVWSIRVRVECTDYTGSHYRPRTRLTRSRSITAKRSGCAARANRLRPSDGRRWLRLDRDGDIRGSIRARRVRNCPPQSYSAANSAARVSERSAGRVRIRVEGAGHTGGDYRPRAGRAS